MQEVSCGYRQRFTHLPNTHWSFLVDGLDDKLFIVEGDVSDLAPWETDLWRQPEEAGIILNFTFCVVLFKAVNYLF